LTTETRPEETSPLPPGEGQGEGGKHSATASAISSIASAFITGSDHDDYFDPLFLSFSRREKGRSGRRRRNYGTTSKKRPLSLRERDREREVNTQPRLPRYPASPVHSLPVATTAIISIPSSCPSPGGRRDDLASGVATGRLCRNVPYSDLASALTAETRPEETFLLPPGEGQGEGGKHSATASAISSIASAFITGSDHGDYFDPLFLSFSRREKGRSGRRRRNYGTTSKKRPLSLGERDREREVNTQPRLRRYPASPVHSLRVATTTMISIPSSCPSPGGRRDDLASDVADRTSPKKRSLFGSGELS